MTDKVIRLFKILLAIQSNPGISAKELADKCETTDRTIYRDMRILDLIAPITNEGYGKGYRFVGNFAMYPLKNSSGVFLKRMNIRPSSMKD